MSTLLMTRSNALCCGQMNTERGENVKFVVLGMVVGVLVVTLAEVVLS